MTRYWELLKQQFSLSAGVMLVYRSNILFFVTFETLFLVSQFLTVRIGYDLAGGAVAGWTREEAYLLTAVNGLSHQLFLCFFINSIFNVGTWVWNGQLDYVLLKPMPPLLGILFNGQFVVSNLPNLAVSLGAVVYFLAGSSLPGAVAWWAPLAFALFVAAGLAVRIGLALLCVAPAFLSERLTDGEDAFWSVASLGRYPPSIYPRALELALTFAVPLGMLAAVPAGVLFGKLSLVACLGAFVGSIAFVALCCWTFLQALARYQSEPFCCSFAHESFSATVLLNTNAPGFESLASTQK
jgi:ABC-2 type transport system permease protein